MSLHSIELRKQSRKAARDRHYQKHKDTIAARRKEKYDPKKNSELMQRRGPISAEQRKQYNETERLKRNADPDYAARRRQDCRERCRKAEKREQYRVYGRNRHARQVGANGKHTAQDITALYASQEGLCAGCQCQMDLSGKNKFHVDHYVPLILGGSNLPGNLQLLCKTCNLMKGMASPEKWEQVIKPRRRRQVASA